MSDKIKSGGEPSCEICGGEGTYPIIDTKGSHRYDIKCPECLGISDEEIERRCVEDAAALSAGARLDPNEMVKR